MSSLHQGFQDSGRLADNEGAFRWLDLADAHPEGQRLKQRMLDICPVAEGTRVLDVGCGIGHEAFRLAAKVGPRGQVTGLDVNPAMITEARRRAAGLDLPVAFEVADARRAGWPDGTFDVCRTERVLRYVDRPAAVLAEMTRLVRPGGSVVAFDFDSDMTLVDAPEPARARRFAELLDGAVPSPWVGRQLFRLFHQAGLRDVRVVPHATCLTGAAGFAIYQQLNRGTIDRAGQSGQVSDGEVAAWWTALEQAGQAGTFFVALLGFIATGDKA